MSLDIIIPAFNNPDITSRCLSALSLFAPKGSRTILVDNGSVDAVKDLKAQVEAMGGTYLRLDPNCGPYGAVNAGLDIATADKVAIVCNDIVVLPGTLQVMADLVSDQTPYIGATGILAQEFNFYDIMLRAALQGGFNRTLLYSGVCFSCFVAQRSLFGSESGVGRFDERFGITFGDTDWEQRYEDSGRPALLAANALVFHGHGVSRKRGGIEADIRNDLRDYNAFVEKWKDRPDVLAKHPRESEEQKRAALNTFWQQGER